MPKKDKNKYKNTVTVEGLLYDHKLEERVTGAQSKVPNTPYIRGSIDIATDDKLTNIVTINFTYITLTDKKYPILKGIIDKIYPTIMTDGAEAATAISCSTSIEINEWFTDKTLDENGQPTLTSVRRLNGGFINIIPRAELRDEIQRDKFLVDVLLTSAVLKEADEEKGYPEKLTLKGWMFNFKEEAFPISFSVLNPDAISYFMSQEPSSKEPLYTQVGGYIVSMTTKTKKEIEGAFSTETVEYTRTNKDWVVNYALKEPYEFDAEGVLGFEDIRTKMKQREEYLAELKHQYEENKKKKAQASPAANINAGGLEFNF